MSQGYLGIVLHAHLPFVRHPEHDFALEEDWLFEAITETYLPLLDMLERLADEDLKFKITMSISPTLCQMLDDPFLQIRYIKHLERLIELSSKEIERLSLDSGMRPLAEMYYQIFSDAHGRYTSPNGANLTGPFKALSDRGVLEIATCAATHGFLPLLAVNEKCVAAQIGIAKESHIRSFGSAPLGIWLPECGYHPNVDKYLKDSDIKYFFADTFGLMGASPRPKYGVFAPLETKLGLSVFGRDMESSRQVWSARAGYPGDSCYRDFYRDIGFDLEDEYLSPYIQTTGQRKMTGIKYHRITGGSGVEKEIYDPAIARQKAAHHAMDFVRSRVEQVNNVSEVLDRSPFIISPYDAELFGHWWFEGPIFLECVIREVCCGDNELELISPTDYLKKYSLNQVAEPALSSWGLKGHNEMWLDESNDWIYRHLHKAGDRMVELSRQFPMAQGLKKRALNQAARELLLAQSSDWAFIMKTGTSSQYAKTRIEEHIWRFTRLYELIVSNSIDKKEIEDLESKDPIFPWIDYTVFSN